MVLQQRVVFSKVVAYNPGLVFWGVFYSLWAVHFIILPKINRVSVGV
jgi:hypothetical protein